MPHYKMNVFPISKITISISTNHNIWITFYALNYENINRKFNLTMGKILGYANVAEMPQIFTEFLGIFGNGIKSYKKME